MRGITRAGLLLGGVVAISVGCSRSALIPGVAVPECAVDSDCAGYGDVCNPVACSFEAPGGSGGAGGVGTVGTCVAQAPPSCDDGDPCTTDTCDSTTGCAHTHATPDADGDGHYAPLPGYLPGATGACGDDCDDTNPNVHPGATEVCDGIDNDCDGIIDNGAQYLAMPNTEVRISSDLAPEAPRALGSNGSTFLGTFTGTNNGFALYDTVIGADGGVETPGGERLITDINADALGGRLVWAGDRYGAAWQDRRTGSYQVYFSLLDATGAKRLADVQITKTKQFSVKPALAWSGQQFFVVWQNNDSGIFNLFGAHLDIEGALVGAVEQLTTSASGGFSNEGPTVAAGLKTVGVAFSQGTLNNFAIEFQAFSTDFATPAAPAVALTDGTTQAIFPIVVWNRDRYVIVWFDQTASPAGIYAATVSEDGKVIAPSRAISAPGAFHSRYPAVLPLGDRLLVTYADDRDQNSGYEIYERTVSVDLVPLSGERRVTKAPRDSVLPFTAFGPRGDVGILFRDDRNNGNQDLYFTHLTCQMGGTPPP